MIIKILVATHKTTHMPTESIYFPIHVGAELQDNLSFTRNNTEENISLRNPYYCELTGLYWSWKNLNCDALGLVHYLRYFGEKNKDNFYTSVIKQDEFERLISSCDVILAKPRNYYIETVREHFLNHTKPKSAGYSSQLLK